MDENYFPISQLPAEIRTQIYGYYFASLPSIPITDTDLKSDADIKPPSTTVHHNLLTHTLLALSSPFFLQDIPLQTFLLSSTFTFTSGSALRLFPSLLPQYLIHPVRKIRIQYQTLQSEKNARDPDWVFLIHEACPDLEEVTFEVGAEVWSGEWIASVRDAVREGWCCGCEMEGRKRGNCGKGVGKGKSQELTLRVECPIWEGAYVETFSRGR
jgi:hypothetical protein